MSRHLFICVVGDPNCIHALSCAFLSVWIVNFHFTWEAIIVVLKIVLMVQLLPAYLSRICVCWVAYMALRIGDVLFVLRCFCMLVIVTC